LGDSELALAGGVYVLPGPTTHVMFSKATMLSPEGRCFTFDQRADGFVPAEGVGVLVLKKLQDAIRDGDRIHGIIRGWKVNQDVKPMGLLRLTKILKFA
jgi:acyl transferase domain-containing protein